ncbi:hypothetical protein HC931_11045 [Candidatus Gracilibacteria bacterium]|nr:hypothetical protein [Candidatus Gracilibacteria bacterium]
MPSEIAGFQYADLIEHQGQMCGQFWLRSDGTVTGKACGEQPLRGRIAITRD